MIDLVEIGIMIRNARIEKGMTQIDLGRVTGVARTRINDIENARAAEVGVMLLQRIMNAVDLDLMPGPFNAGRPTLEQLRTEEEDSHAPRLGR